MTIYSQFLMPVKVIKFVGEITYNENGFAVLPCYETTSGIPVSMQPIKKSILQFLPEGTHYSDYFQFITDYPVFEDITINTHPLGSYIIDFRNRVFKVISDQNFHPFRYMSTNHVEGIVCLDNRLKYNGTCLSLPYPEIDGLYAPLFELIAMVRQVFTYPCVSSSCSCLNSCSCSSSSSSCTSSSSTCTMPVLWAYQQELHPRYPYCTVTLECIENIDNTNFVGIDPTGRDTYTSVSNQLLVSFRFFALDQIQALNAMQKFKLNYVNYSFSTELFAFIGFVEEQNEIEKQLYEEVDFKLSIPPVYT